MSVQIIDDKENKGKIKVIIFKWPIHEEKRFIPEFEEFLNQLNQVDIISITSWYADLTNYTQVIYRKVR